jgi:cytochrome subunit of sulfide dehydrogenase
MQAFRAGQRPATVMDRIVKGFSDPEIAAIAAWYAAQND